MTYHKLRTLYIMQHKNMTPEDAYCYVRSIRPRVLLASAQWQAVKEYYNVKVKSSGSGSRNDLIIRSPKLPLGKLFEFDDGAVVVETKSDLDGYNSSNPRVEDRQILTDLSIIYKACVVGQAAVARLSCLWICCHTPEQLHRKGSCTIRAEQFNGNLTVDIHVY